MKTLFTACMFIEGKTAIRNVRRVPSNHCLKNKISPLIIKKYIDDPNTYNPYKSPPFWLYHYPQPKMYPYNSPCFCEKEVFRMSRLRLRLPVLRRV